MTFSSPRRTLFSHSLVCSKNYLFIVVIGPISDKDLYLFFDHIDLIVRTFYVRKQSYKIHLWYTVFEYDLYCIVFQYISFLEHNYQYNIYAIIFISLHRTVGPSPCLLIDIYNTFVVITTDKPQIFTVVIWLHRILFQKYGQTLRLHDLLTQR